MINVLLSNYENLEWSIEQINNEISKLKSDNFFIIGLLIFLAGVILQIIAVFVETKKQPITKQST